MMLMYRTAQMHPVPDIRSPGLWQHKANGTWCSRWGNDQGLQGYIDFKVAFSKADILHHSYKVQNINFIVNELIQHKHVDIANTKIISRMICSIWVVLLYQSSHWYALYRAEHLDNGIWALIYQDWKPALLSPVVSLSKQSANLAQRLRILGLVRWKSSRKWGRIYTRLVHSKMSITLLHTYFLECCGIKTNWTLIAEWDTMHSCLRKPNSLFFLVIISIARTVRQVHEWRHGRIKYEWRFWIPLVVLTLTNSCCISSKSPARRPPTGCAWTPPTCTWSHWPLSWMKHPHHC